MLLIIPAVQCGTVGESGMAATLNSKSDRFGDGCSYCDRRLVGKILWADHVMCPECFVEVVQDILQTRPCVTK